MGPIVISLALASPAAEADIFVAADGAFVTAWAYARDGAYQVRMARIEIS